MKAGAAPASAGTHTGQGQKYGALDGLRGLAVLAVVFHHALANARIVGVVAQAGWVGVDLFFVISGFLITGILLQQRGSTGYFRSFYIRRALRIWPLYAVLLALTAAVAPGLTAMGQPPPLGTWLPHALVFLQNFRTSPFEPWPIAVTWSLAIEEQFYVFWPLLVRAVVPVRLAALAMGILVLEPVARALALYWGVPPVSIYTWTAFRLDGLAMGILLALWMRGGVNPAWRALFIRWGSLFLPAGVALAVLLGEAKSATAPLPWALGSGLLLAALYSCLSLGFGALLWRSVEGSVPRWWQGLLAQRWLRFAGTISFCLYLVHSPIFALSQVYARPLVREWLPWPGSLVTALCIAAEIGAAVLVSTVSWYGLESRLLRLKDVWAPQRP